MNGVTQLGDFSISIHSPHTRGDAQALVRGRHSIISIHSPHTRGDSTNPPHKPIPIKISIHSPHTRGDCLWMMNFSRFIHFNPLPSHEGRRVVPLTVYNYTYFNPLPSHEGRQHKPPKIHPDLRQLTQQNHDTPLFGALQAPFCGAEPDIRGAKPTGKP